MTRAAALQSAVCLLLLSGCASQAPVAPPPKLEGLLTEYYDDAKQVKKSEGTYKRGRIEGTYTVWWPNGNKMREARYAGGARDGQETLWHENGVKMSEGGYKNDLRDGKFETWYAGGQKRTETTYALGKKNGPYLGWWENGSKMAEGTYKKDRRIGKFTVWERDGETIRFQKEYEEQSVLDGIFPDDPLPLSSVPGP